MGSLEGEAAKKRYEAVEWLNSLFPDFNVSCEASEDELKARLFDGTVLCSILTKLNPSIYEESRGSDYLSSEHRLVKIKRFLSAIEDMGLPTFKVSDLEQGSISAVVLCLLALRDQFRDASVMAKFGSNRWRVHEDRLAPINASRREPGQSGMFSFSTEDDRRVNSPESRLQRALPSSIMSEPSSPSSAMAHHVGHKFHEVFQLKQGRYSDLPSAKISEIMKSNSLDNAPTQSLLSVVNGILDESIERKNGEIPHRVACLLRKVVQEIERRISTQAEHIRNQNNLIKAREEKYQSRIRALETLATGTNEESQVVANQLQLIKTEKSKTEEIKRLGEQDLVKLAKEKENSDNMVLELKQELEVTKRTYEDQLLELESKASESKAALEKMLKDAELLLAKSKSRIRELEVSSESKFENWNKKQVVFNKFIDSQFQSVQSLRIESESIRNQIVSAQREWHDEFNNLGLELKVLVDAAENYNTVLAENKKLYNEVQDLKGNIRVYCRVRPFLPGQSKKATTVDYIGENGELLVVNPSKPGKEGHRMFKFNKIFGPTASQEEVYLDTQPLIRSILDGYNVCIFAYGQTGSGKTYTMSGPTSASKEDWGVNYRALNDLFHISRTRRNTFMYEVGVQMVEIYNEQVRDLLANGGSQKKLGIWSTTQPNGLAVPDASMHPVSSTSDVIELMQVGLANRAVSATALNERSSRSHSILTVHVRGVDLKTGTTTRGSLHMVDLAGSERVDRSEVTGDRLKEAQYINKSLSALGDVIFALSQKSSHIPYRNSKLTQILQSSLGGQAKTLMFVQINPDTESYSETFSTLKFAERVSGVELGAARSNKEGKDIKDLMEQVASLKDTIARKDEEIEQLQILNDAKIQSPTLNHEKNGGTLRHSASAPGMTTQQNRRISGGKIVRPNVKAAFEPDSYSDHSDRQSEAGSHQSLDEFKHQRDNIGQSKLSGEDSSQNFSADVELLGFGEAESDERLSDISDGGLSMGTETDGSMGSVVEYTLFPENVKRKEAKAGKTLSVPAKVAKVPQKIAQTSVRPKLTNSIKTSGIRTSGTQATTASSAKSTKRWQ